MRSFGTESWEKNQLQHSATATKVTLSMRMHKKLCKSSVPYVSQTSSSCRLLVRFRIRQLPVLSLVFRSVRLVIPHAAHCSKTHQSRKGNCDRLHVGEQRYMQTSGTHTNHRFGLLHYSVRLTWKSGTTSDTPWGSWGSFRRMHR